MNPAIGLLKFLYWPLCRAYARLFIGDKPADSILRFLSSVQFWVVHRFWPDFVHPTRFSEKMWSRMLRDRNPKLTLISDKLQVRDYVNEIVGSEYLVPMLWSGDNPEEIPLDMLPTRFVIKTNHGCRYNIIVEDKAKYDRVEAQLKLTRWLSENFCQDKFLGTEWGYKNIKPTIIVESFIGENRKPPIDYKFWCFSGRVECLTMHFNRFTEHEFRAFNRSFEPIDFGFGPTLPVFKGEWERPSNYETMLRVAESLAKEFGFMRVDLYNLGNKIYFGELTPYPGGITVRFCPPSWDRLLGEKWKGM